MAFAIARGCETFDFTIGDERYKREWAEVTVALHDYRRAASLRGLALVLMATATARVKRFIKQNPTLWSAALKVREIAWRRSSAPPRPKPAAEDP
jgi:CelD/BcsL family acetyltransferase involved in cellulose biosynthesis